VVGPGSGVPAAALGAAEEAGSAVAAAGAGLVCGGLTLGLLPGTSRDDANGWVVVAVPTGLGEARNALVVRAADAVVAIGGEPDGIVRAADARAAVAEALRLSSAPPR